MFSDSAQSPEDAGDPKPLAVDTSTEHLIPRVQLLLRVLGVFFVIYGASGMLGYGIEIGHSYWLATRYYGYGWAEAFRMSDVAWFCSSFLQLAAGLYLAVDGRRVIEKVFLPASRETLDECEDGDAAEGPSQSESTDERAKHDTP